jgi:iron complex outermembrane recepter protein
MRGLNQVKILFCWGLWLLLLAGPALGEEAKTVESPPGQEGAVPEEKPVTVEQLPQIEVLAHAEKAATSTVVTKDDMGLGPYQNLPGYLEEQTGVDMTRRSMLGVKSRQMTLRGFDESRYQIYLNGRSWKGAGVKGGYYVDWTTITPTDLERLEIIRGSLSAEYPNTLGGVITINTQRGSKEPKLYLDTYWGSWATQNYRLLHTGGKGPVQYSIAGSFGNTDGYLRNNFVHDRVNFDGSLTFTFPFDLSLTGSGRYISQKTGMIVYNRPDSKYYDSSYPISDGDALYGPGINFIGGTNGGDKGLTYGDDSYVHSQRIELDFEAKQKFLYGEALFHLFYFQAVRQERFYALNDPTQLIATRGSDDEDTWGWNFKVRQTPGKVRLGFGLEGNYYGYGGLNYNYLNPAYLPKNYRTLYASSSGNRNAQKLHGGFVDAAIPFLKYFELYLGLRYDNYDAAPQFSNDAGAPVTYTKGLRKDALSPKTTLTIRPTDTTEAYLAVNYSTRFPTLPEYYWYGHGYQPASRSDNDTLSPEFGMQYEAGITQKLPLNAQIRVRGYYYDINNYIRTVFGYRPSRVIYNLDLAKLRGVEVETQMGLPYHLTAYANYTWQQTSTSPDPLSGNVTELAELPDHKAHIGLKYKNPNGAEGRMYVRLVSKRAEPNVTVKSNKVSGFYYRPMNGFCTFNLEGRYPVLNYHGFKGFLYFGVENLFSEKYQEDAGYPMPPNTFYGGMQLRY